MIFLPYQCGLTDHIHSDTVRKITAVVSLNALDDSPINNVIHKWLNQAARRRINLLLLWQSEPIQKTGAFGKVFPA
ncbi:hypothetical protein [Dickeya dadantii]|uniref:hypothetical protein n=1 Tax=Dickeya dadantii TaxID=204038 RepID=UPI001C0C73A0|nr:hypothetical protein [Dickeya dadantii]QWT39524.1 hypothetical protein KNV89_14180 [Dickeya dadantii]